ncbi:hypothetical protein [Globicatella sanguinis]|nr:hypothetical protein [Globicatella sanguinis]
MNYEKTGDIQNLMDIPRILSKTKSPVGAGLIETTYKILFLFKYIKRKGV